jgi:hypothetical protein
MEMYNELTSLGKFVIQIKSSMQLNYALILTNTGWLLLILSHNSDTSKVIFSVTVRKISLTTMKYFLNDSKFFVNL